MNITLDNSTANQNTILKENNCKYCSGFLKQGYDKTNSPWDEILFETDNFVVVSTLGAIVEGWLLIVSKDHYLCMGALPKSLWPELLDLKSFFSNLLTEIYGPITMFEHGPHSEKLDIGCGIDHAHLHLVPLKFSLLSRATDSAEISGPIWYKLHSLEQTAKFYNDRKSFIFIEEPNCSISCCTLNSAPCQFIRKLIAREIGVHSKYNYWKHDFKENVILTVEKVKKTLDNY
ncbi:MAG TPA: hypothetical protein ENH94_04600 [Phycisphaerales bacterium]|nr:hypothetical protein [Phycisphaerales bacterium]